MHKALDGLILKIADERETQLALEMRLEIYERAWPGVPVGKCIDVLDQGSYHLIAVARDEGTIVGAARVVPPSRRPFELEHCIQLASFIPDQRVPGEIGRFCIREQWRHVRRPFVSVGILKLAISLSRKLRLTDLVLLARPELIDLYRLGFFAPANIVYQHPTWGEVHAMRLDLKDVSARLANSSQPIARLLFETELDENILV